MNENLAKEIVDDFVLIDFSYYPIIDINPVEFKMIAVLEEA